MRGRIVRVLYDIYIISLCCMIVFADFKSDCMSLSSQPNADTLLYRGNCIVAHHVDKDWQTARDSCVDMSHGGHLAFIQSTDIQNAITPILEGVYWIGLWHGTSTPIKQDWWWYKSAQQKYQAFAEITPWKTAEDEPDNPDPSDPPRGEIRLSHGLGLFDFRSSYTLNITYVSTVSITARDFLGAGVFYLRELGLIVGHPKGKYRYDLVPGGKIPPAGAVIGDYPGVSHISKCAEKCSKDTICYSLAYNKNTGHCLNVALPVAQIPSPVLNDDYENYDKTDTHTY